MQQLMTEIDEATPETLKQAWRELRARQPQMRIREAAASLGVSEAELLATTCGNGAIRLVARWPELLTELSTCGSLMALTRNDFAVHEKTGLYGNLSVHGEQWLVSGQNIRLCLLLLHWYAGFAVSEETHAGVRHSLHFFARDGEAIHKIYLAGAEHLAGYQRLIEVYRADDQSPGLQLPVSAPQTAVRMDELPPLWRRLWACNTASGETTPVVAIADMAVTQFRQLMHQLAQMLLPVEIAVVNQGAMQVHEGLIQNLHLTGPWFNVLDTGFNLHLNETAIERMQVVNIAYRQHTLNGLLLLDKQGQTIVSIFGQYDDETGESPIWREFVAALPKLPCKR